MKRREIHMDILLDALRNGQRRLDADGIEIGISRIAVDDAAAELERLTAALKAAKWEIAAAFKCGQEVMRDRAAKTASSFELGPPDEDYLRKRPEDAPLINELWERTQDTVKAIRSLPLDEWKP